MSAELAAAGPALDLEELGWRLVRPTADHAETVASWPRSAEEAARWASKAIHPFPAEDVSGWWGNGDVQPWLLLGPDGEPVGYGEVWDDEAEDEVELARLIVDPGRRRRGVGRRLVDQLLVVARRQGRADCFLRVAPDNTAALALYRAAGFDDVDPVQTGAWNEHQPVAYVWLQRRLQRSPTPSRADPNRTPVPASRPSPDLLRKECP